MLRGRWQNMLTGVAMDGGALYLEVVYIFWLSSVLLLHLYVLSGGTSVSVSSKRWKH